MIGRDICVCLSGCCCGCGCVCGGSYQCRCPYIARHCINKLIPVHTKTYGNVSSPHQHSQVASPLSWRRPRGPPRGRALLRCLHCVYMTYGRPDASTQGGMEITVKVQVLGEPHCCSTVLTLGVFEWCVYYKCADEVYLRQCCCNACAPLFKGRPIGSHHVKVQCGTIQYREWGSCTHSQTHPMHRCVWLFGLASHNTRDLMKSASASVCSNPLLHRTPASCSSRPAPADFDSI